ncbi:hypothetical protein HK405_011617 [Cladochytrium tenue]|nr:hypothetical protein HK405_011617 [Cladochytrium tenue]
MSRLIAAVLLAAALSVNVLAAPWTSCKCFPGDDCWPKKAVWDSFNATVAGRLIATVPIGAVCHDPAYDNATCSALQDDWQYPPTHISSSSSIMAPFFANQSCDPFYSRSIPCTLGNYVVYSVNATGADDIIATINFARKYNIRLVIRNTGHDYLGRSTGAGALGIWTHYLKSIDFNLNYDDGEYAGPAVKVGAGVEGYEILTAGRDQGLVVVGGECPTVGIAGGYTQGGGHSALSTTFGLSADNVLEWEAVTADGKHVIANRKQNSDLYWALSGGGGGNYAVVLSMTVKAFPDTHIGGAKIVMYNAPIIPSQPNFTAAVDAFHAALPSIIDAGIMVVYYYSSVFFQIAALTAYNKTQAEVETVLAPLRATFEDLNVSLATDETTESSTYFDHYFDHFGPYPYGSHSQIATSQYGSRFLPRSVFENNVTAVTSVANKIVADYPGTIYIGISLDVSKSGGNNAANPAWRNTLVHTVIATPFTETAEGWDSNIELQDAMTNDIIPLLESISPGQGSYINEGNFQQPNFQSVFYGSNYDKLLAIKKARDPAGMFYATKAVGSEFWTVSNDGRLCRAQ